MSFIFVFPGQGSQAIGMGQSLYQNFKTAQHTLEEIEDAISFKLSTVMFEGPLDTLTLTENTQPALFAASLMTVKVMESETGKPLSHMTLGMAGHSLGEYSALCAAGVLSVKDTALAVHLRGKAMQSAVPSGMGAMAAILGLDRALIQKAIADFSKPDHLCTIANDNSPGQIVISGHTQAINDALQACMAAGAKRGILLPVSAPFHSPLMAPAAAQMKDVLSAIDFAFPCCPVVMNVTAMPVFEPEPIKPLLIEQICGQVRWTESVQTLVHLAQKNENDPVTFVEVGSGKVLSGLIKRIDGTVVTQNVHDVDDMKLFLERMKGI